MTDIIDRLLNEEAKAQLKGQRALAETCRDASDQLGLIMEERDRLREALRRLEARASYVAKRGADTGSHWAAFDSAIIHARAALKETDRD